MFQWENLEKSQFYKGLPEVMINMPHRVKLNRIFPALIKEFLNHDMVPFVLPNVLLIVEESSNEEFLNLILPELLPVLRMKEPIQVSIILMEKMELLLEKSKSNPDAIKDCILPLMSRCLEADATQVQQLSLTTVPTVAHLLDGASLKNAIMPRIKKLCLETNQLAIRVTALLSLAKLLDHLDKWLVIDEIVPFLPRVPSKEPAVIMAIVGIYKTIMNHNKLGLTKEVIANKVIPFLMPIAIENGLSVNQFNGLMSLIKNLINQVETEHGLKLEQLNSIKASSNMAVISYKSEHKPKSSSQALDLILEGEPIVEKSSDFGGQKNLSLQDKERMWREKEAANRLQAQENLIPERKAPMNTYIKQHTQPKDLTSSLINSNLANLSLGKASTTTPGMGTGPNYNIPMTSQMNPMASNFMFSSPSQANVSLHSNSHQSPLDKLLIPGFSKSNNKTPMNKLSETEIKDLLN